MYSTADATRACTARLPINSSHRQRARNPRNAVGVDAWTALCRRYRIALVGKGNRAPIHSFNLPCLLARYFPYSYLAKRDSDDTASFHPRARCLASYTFLIAPISPYDAARSVAGRTSYLTTVRVSTGDASFLSRCCSRSVLGLRLLSML